MLKTVIILVVVFGIVVGGLLRLRNSTREGMPGEDVLDRAKQRAREQAAKDDAERDP
jgi:hypothetical protein